MPDRLNKPLLALEQAVEVFLRAQRLLTAGDRVVVGVSGGADSVALLSALGMSARRRLGGCEVVLIRPLLASTKAEIEAYCAQRDLPWREDETNENVNFKRNFIRHRLLPLLREKLNPRVDEAMLRLASAAEAAETHLLAEGGKALDLALEADEAEETVRLNASSLASQPALIQGYALRTAMERMGIGLRSIGSQQLEALAELLTSTTPKTICLPGGIVARRKGDQLVIEPAPAARVEGLQSSAALACPGQTEIAPGLAISCQIEPYDEQVFQAHCQCPADGVELLDADAVVGNLSARPRRDGDAFVPLGAPGRQTVSDFLTNLKLPQSRRRRAVCICDELGMIYLAPLRIDDRVKVRPASRLLLRISFHQGGG